MKISNIIEVFDKNFNEIVLLSKKYVLVDFWADWCGPCKILAPILEDIADQYLGKIIVGKMNVDKNSLIPPKYSIRGIPSLLLFYNSQVIGTKIGALSKVELIDFLNTHLNQENI
ncbi:thioredoxin [Buchnera aphidicola]|uniref:thioredoxin n=1 Tax=Buchnera aphidicola TaxID=9 RepID=UPI000B224287|nr:thioredoxin [Buchnera aphidicola]